MIICIPTVDEKGFLSTISKHLGRTPYLTILYIEDNKIEAIKTIKNNNNHQKSAPAPTDIIINSKTNILICTNLGPKAMSILHENNIQIFAPVSGKVKDVIHDWKEHTLPLAEQSPCNECSC